jgi:hypothetical protein
MAICCWLAIITMIRFSITVMNVRKYYTFAARNPMQYGEFQPIELRQITRRERSHMRLSGRRPGARGRQVSGVFLPMNGKFPIRQVVCPIMTPNPPFLEQLLLEQPHTSKKTLTALVAVRLFVTPHPISNLREID